MVRIIASMESVMLAKRGVKIIFSRFSALPKDFTTSADAASGKLVAVLAKTLRNWEIR